MKNKFICALLTTVMVLSFAACGNEGNGAAASAESTVASESQVTESNTEANTETASTENFGNSSSLRVCLSGKI